MNKMMKILHLFTLLIALGRVASEATPPGSVVMRIQNNAGLPVELFWVNIFEAGNPLVKQTSKPIRNSTDTVINSYNTHEFVVKFLNSPVDGTEPQASFMKGPKEEVITISYSPEDGMTFTQVTKFDELLVKVRGHSTKCDHLQGDAFHLCFTTGIADDVIQLEEKRTQLTKYRDAMSSRLRNYTCEDPKMESSKPVKSTSMLLDNIRYPMDIMFDSPSAKIWVMHNFITEDECKILETHGRPKLTRATVAGEDGMSMVSENRKAQQASYNKHQGNKEDPLFALDNRIREVTNRHAGYNLQAPGQEDYTIIQYNKDDQYTPHCDGSCDGTDHKAGGRVATAVMYCKVATKGGGTTFTKADVFVKPTAGMATFFSYKGPDGKMEDGFTEHSGCPVLEGEKWITTAWMREGVTKEEPWNVFDPSGVKVESTSYDAVPEPEVSQSSESETEEQAEITETEFTETEITETEIEEPEFTQIEIVESEFTDISPENQEEEVEVVTGIITEEVIAAKPNFLGNIFNSFTGFNKKVASKSDL